jgi:hypothetical protein
MPLLLVDKGYLLFELATEVLKDPNEGFDYVGFLLLGCQVDHRPGALDSKLMLSCHRALPPLDQE